MAGKKSQTERDSPPEVRFLRRRKQDNNSHGTWKVAYADLVTTLMAIFIVLWASSLSPEVRRAIGSYFREPSVWTHGGGRSVLTEGAGLLPMQPKSAEAADDTATLEEAAAQLTALLDAHPEFNKIRDQIRIDITPEGLRIELVEKDDSLFFDIGSATLKPATRELFAIIAKLVGRLPNHVAIEGHTDARPYQRMDYSNWELSTDRANTARRAMQTSGLHSKQVTRVVGYADLELLNRSDPFDTQNRRVSIIVMKRKNPEAGTIADVDERQLLAETDNIAVKTSY